jgi:eukaryotic-like serine/threonine-protein kinase
MLSPGVRLGPYEILAPLGAGGMGEVFRARDTRLGRQVAVKILPDAVSQDASRVTRFETEARALAALSHPNILAIHDFGVSDGRVFTVTELLEGETLRARMGGEPVPWRKAAEIAASIADALASAHAAGIVHRDLKPENVFLTSDGRTKVLDFGLARIAEPVSESAVTLTSPSPGPVSAAGEIVGTLSYMAPEQLRGLKVDGRTDIFALGCVLFEMLSGERPFAGATPADTIAAILHAEPPPLDGALLPPALETIVSRCLEKRPEDRFDTAHDVALALRGISTDHQPVSRSGERRAPVRPKKIGPAAIGGAAALVLLAAAIYVGRPRAPARAAAGDAVWGRPRQFTSAPEWDADPAISPDGTLVAYVSNSSGEPEIWVVDPDGGEPLRLTHEPAENRKPAWFPDGRSIAYGATRNGSASVWRISRLGGSASLLLEGGDMPAISPDGTRIAFVRPGANGLGRIWVAPVGDPARAERLTGDDGGEWEHTDPAWSPDGTLLCYSAFSDLWLVSAAGGSARRLTTGGHADRRPAFSPDGAFVFFSSQRTHPASIWRVARDGGAPEQVLSGPGMASQPSLSRDGRRLVFSTAVLHIYVEVVDRKSGTVSRIIASGRDASMPAMAPDGSAVAYCSNRLGTDDLWLEPLEEGRIGRKGARRLTNLSPGPATPAFSRDGRWIAFFRHFNGHRDLWAVPLNGGAPRALVEGAGDNIHPAYSPDGTRLAFVSNRSGHEHVWILPLQALQPAGEPWRLTEGDVTDSFPAFSPDGGRIAFVRGDDAWIADAQPRAVPRRVTTGAEAVSLAWEPDGSALLVSGLFGTRLMHVRRIRLASGAFEDLKPPVVLGDRNAGSLFSLSRDGRFLAAEITEFRGNLWITTASRDGR